MALLAKQAWRMFEKPDSLMARIFKAKYFSTSTILEAKTGSTPSFSWRCIHESKAGLRWRIGSGDNIRVWGDAWIPRPTTFRIITPPVEGYLNYRVSGLRDYESGEWDAALIQHIFWPEDAEAILALPLGERDTLDKQIWHYSSSGLFTVKSAYHLTVERGLHQGNSVSGSGSSMKTDWNFLWKPKYPTKINLFSWRMCHNILPSRSALAKRRVDVGIDCPICGGEIEDIRHCVVTCHVARQVWALLFIGDHALWREGEDCFSWLRRIFVEYGVDTMAKIVTTCWALWGNRNRIVAGDNAMQPLSIATFVCANLEFWQVTSEGRRGSPDLLGPSRVVMTAPWFRVRVDAAINCTTTTTGLGIIVHNHLEEFVRSEQRCLTGCMDSRNAEAHVLWAAVRMAEEQQWERVIFEGDCLGVMNDVWFPENVNGDHADFIGNIVRTWRRVGPLRWCFFWIPRESNGDAHTLAREATLITPGDIHVHEEDNLH